MHHNKDFKSRCIEVNVISDYPFHNDKIGIGVFRIGIQILVTISSLFHT